MIGSSLRGKPGLSRPERGGRPPGTDDHFFTWVEVGRNATAIAQLDADEAASNSGGALGRIISPLDDGEAAGLAMADVAGRLAATNDGVG